jgi:hypothetical protein
VLESILRENPPAKLEILTEEYTVRSKFDLSRSTVGRAIRHGRGWTRDEP